MRKLNLGMCADPGRVRILVRFCENFYDSLNIHNIFMNLTILPMISCKFENAHSLLAQDSEDLEQIAKRISLCELDLLFYFRDPLLPIKNKGFERSLIELCDYYNVPIATSVSSAKLFVAAIKSNVVLDLFSCDEETQN